MRGREAILTSEAERHCAMKRRVAHNGNRTDVAIPVGSWRYVDGITNETAMEASSFEHFTV